MSVDLPAPLSPSRQSTSPGVDLERDVGAATSVPTKDLLTLSSFSSGAVMVRPSSSGGCGGQREPAEGVVHQDGDQQQDAEDEARPVGVPAGVVDALVDDREGERAEDDADDGAVAAGEQHAADDDGDDRVEDERLAVGDLRAVVEDRLDDADEGGPEAAAHVQGDLDLVGRDAGGAGALLVAADREDPVAVARSRAASSRRTTATPIHQKMATSNWPPMSVPKSVLRRRVRR